MPFAGVAVIALLTLILCGVGVLVAVIGRWRKSRTLVIGGVVPVSIVLALVILAVMEGYLPLDWQARLHMSLPPEARVVKIQSDSDRIKIVFRLPEVDANGFNPEAFRSVWRNNVGSYTYPCGGMSPGQSRDPEVACGWDGDGEKRLVFDRDTHCYSYSVR